VDEYKSRLSSYLSDMVREELVKYDGGYTDEWNDQRKKNAEVLGYKLSGKSDIKEYWWDDLDDKVKDAYIKKHGEAPKRRGSTKDKAKSPEKDKEKSPEKKSIMTGKGRKKKSNPKKWEDIKAGDVYQLKNGELMHVINSGDNHIQTIIHPNPEHTSASGGKKRKRTMNFAKPGKSQYKPGFDPTTATFKQRIRNRVNPMNFNMIDKSTERKDESVTETKKRDYKAEYQARKGTYYDKYQSSTKAKKYRAELNQYNRKKGTYGNGDKKDASHKGGKIVGFESQSKNRSRKEKSRLKKEAISKAEWSQYPKYARKLKPYMKKLFKVPVRVRVIKQANHNPWIEVRVARFGKDIIPNDFRVKAAKVIGARGVRDWDNVNYGNIRVNSISLKYDEWKKLLGNKVKESLTKENLKKLALKEIKSILTEGTRWNVGIEAPNGKIASTYGHWDGYPEYAGKMLKRYYSNTGKVKQLLKLGKQGISSIDKSMKGGKDHTFNNAKKGETIFYGRDRGEKDNNTNISKNREDLLNGRNRWSGGTEFMYIWSVKDKKWYYVSRYSNPREWTELK